METLKRIINLTWPSSGGAPSAMTWGSMATGLFALGVHSSLGALPFLIRGVVGCDLCTPLSTFTFATMGSTRLRLEIVSYNAFARRIACVHLLQDLVLVLSVASVECCRRALSRTQS
eukprot:scaffold44080_cov36-Tisochrysis_lutea.AAC.5